MTDDELQAIEARANAATPGPWHLAITTDDDPEYANIEAGSIDIADDVENRNAIFIYHAREDVPALVAEVRELTGRVDILTAENARLREAVFNLERVLREASRTLDNPDWAVSALGKTMK